MKGTSGAASADTRTVRNTPDPPVFQDTSSAVDQFAHSTRLALKLQSVKEQLDSVLEPHQRSSASGLIYDQDKSGISHAMRSLTLDSGMMGLNASLPPPSHLSPHSKLQLSSSATERRVPSASPTTHSRGFSPVGQRLRGASSFRQHRNVPDHLSPDVREDPDTGPVEQTVVCLYDYRANRSDELTLRRGDVIHVLYKDNDSWWFGRLDDGRQGYFLASYVTDERKHSEEAQAALSDGTVDRATPTRVSAAVSSSGELRFLSEPTLSDTDPELTDTRTKRKKKVKKAGGHAPSSQATPSAPDASGSGDGSRRVLTRGRPLPKRPSGRTNSAFEADA